MVYLQPEISYTNETTVSIVFGIGLGVRLGKIVITIEPRYALGLSTIVEDDLTWEIGKSQTFSIAAGVSL